MNKRLIASVFIYQGKCYQTLSYKNYRPLGDLINILEILDKHQVDEIFISNRIDNLQSIDINVLEKIKSSKVYTPIVYSGGLSNFKDVNIVLSYGVDRVGINSCLWNENNTNQVISAIGKQGVIGVLPFKYINNEIYFFYSKERLFKKANINFIKFIKNLKIEILLIDVLADGYLKGFNKKVLKLFSNCQLILQGGLLSILHNYKQSNISGIAIENRLLWEEQNSIKIREETNFFLKRNLEVQDG